MSYYYYQVEGGEEAWQALPAKMRATHEASVKPRYYTVLSVSSIVTSDLSAEEKDKLKYEGPLYFDWDARDDLPFATEQAVKLLTKFEEMGVDMQSVAMYATGGKGYHAEIPMACFMEKPQALAYLPLVYREIALDVAVDSLDLRVYSRQRGRMWRTPNVKRENGAFKVPITWAELQAMTPERYADMCSSPRLAPVLAKPVQSVALTIRFDEAAQKVKTRLAGRKKRANPDIERLKQMALPSLDALLAGYGVKPDVGFHPIAMQLAIVSETLGWSEEQLVAKAEGLINVHAGDGNRYNTPAKRAIELQRMHRYMHDNPCYEFSVGALKTMLSHDAPDLDGIPVTAEQINTDIAKAAEKAATPHDPAAPPEIALDAYNDIASGLDMTKYGIYITTEFGKKRICALSFEDVEILRDALTGNVSCYSAMVLVNGKQAGRQTLELEIFSGLQAFNRYASRLAHVMQGSDQHVRALMLRVAQEATVNNKVRYVAKREGLDVINIPGHENPELHTPFLMWADASGVMLEKRAQDTGVEMSFQGFPDPRGTYRTDLTDAPMLTDWVKTPEKENFRTALHSLISCQRPEVISNFLGWYTACFYRMLFNRVYQKFPLLHVNGHAGAGKTEMNRAMLSMFYFNQSPKELTPQSSIFAIQQHLSGSSSIPLMIDEYKPDEMSPELHNKLKLLWRDAYNNREITKGGGNRDSDDFRSLNLTQISAPIVFISESMEQEPATMERVVLVSVVRPQPEVAQLWHARFQEFQMHKQSLGVLGQFMAADIVFNYSLDMLREEFDTLYNAAQTKYMLTTADLNAGLSPEALRVKQGAKQRTVFNFCVSQFGLMKFKALVDRIYGAAEFAESFEILDSSIYSKMSDLLPATQAEYLKVINQLAAQSFEDRTNSSALVQQIHYAKIDFGGKAAIEFSMRACYSRYRIHCKNIGIKPLFTGEPAFMHAMKDSNALLQSRATSATIQAPGGTFVFDMDELRKMGVEDFKD